MKTFFSLRNLAPEALAMSLLWNPVLGLFALFASIPILYFKIKQNKIKFLLWSKRQRAALIYGLVSTVFLLALASPFIFWFAGKIVPALDSFY